MKFSRIFTQLIPLTMCDVRIHHSTLKEAMRFYQHDKKKQVSRDMFMKTI